MAAALDENPAIQNPAYRPAGIFNSLISLLSHGPAGAVGYKFLQSPNPSLSLMSDKFRIAGSVPE
jgi:hypothetical protein